MVITLKLTKLNTLVTLLGEMVKWGSPLTCFCKFVISVEFCLIARPSSVTNIFYYLIISECCFLYRARGFSGGGITDVIKSEGNLVIK